MDDPIAQKLTDIIRAHIPDEKPQSFALDDRLDALGLDSLGLAETVFEIEDEYGVELPEPEDLTEMAQQFQTVNDLVLAVRELVSQKRETSS